MCVRRWWMGEVRMGFGSAEGDLSRAVAIVRGGPGGLRV